MGSEKAIRGRLASARLIVVKLGSSILTDGRGWLENARIARIAEAIHGLQEKGTETVLVTSGAVAAGVGCLGLGERPHAIHQVQAAAAVGQTRLIDAYEEAFGVFGVRVALVLLTHDDVSSRERYLNARSTLRALLDMGVLPVVNENDTVATDELRFGDNDVLAGLVTNLLDADALIMLTDQPGLFDRDPRSHDDARLLRFEWAHDKGLNRLMNDAPPGPFGRGGIASKVAAARLAARSGASTFICDGRAHGPLDCLHDAKAPGTLIAAKTTPMLARKRWIADQPSPKGELVLDAGAVRAVVDTGSSLLSIGVLDCRGQFGRGDLVHCVDHAGNLVAKCLVNYSSEETSKILGVASSRIEALLGYVLEPELAHRDNLVPITDADSGYVLDSLDEP